MTTIARLLVQCPDGRGITAAVTTFIAERGGNLLDLEQHTDPDQGEFMLRAVLESTEPAESLDSAFSQVGETYSMQWRLVDANRPRRIVILAGRNLHCLVDLLFRTSNDDLPGDVVSVISNHEDASGPAGHHRIPFTHLPIDPSDPARQATEVGETLDRLDPDLVILARYMRILPPSLASRWSSRMINVHHSFLPAFPGADPYRQAYERGVKLVGATAHYVTPELDEGPIIAQAATTVDHHQSVSDLRRMGADLERLALADAVRAHLEDRILIKSGRTIVFR